MSLSAALKNVSRKPCELRLRAELAEALAVAGAIEEATAVWQATAMAAAGRGEFFVALALGRRFLDDDRLRHLLVELGSRFGANRPRLGPLMPAPAFDGPELDVPDDPDEQVFLALKLGTDIEKITLPKFGRMPAIPIFEELPDEDVVALCNEIEAVILHDGLRLLEQGSSERKVYLLVQGYVRATSRRDDDTEAVWGVRSGPSLLGEMSLLTESPRRTTLTAMGPGIAWRLDAERVIALGRERPALIDRIRQLVKQNLLDDLLSSSKVLSSLPDKAGVVSAFALRTLPNDAVVVAQGSAPPGLFFILHGRAVVWRADALGTSAMVTELTEGDAFGTLSLLTGEATTANVVMPEGGVVLHLPADAWATMKETAPALDAGLSELAEVRRGVLEHFLAESAVELIEGDDLAWVVADGSVSQGAKMPPQARTVSEV